MLSTYVKWLNLFPEIREQLLFVLNRYRHVLDAELQQRACEYVALAELPSDELLQIVCEEMPPFQEKSSLLLSRLQRKHGDTEDKRTWIIGGKEVNRDRDQARQESLKKGVINGGAMPQGPPATLISADDRRDIVTANGQGANGQEDLLADLDGLDIGAGDGAALIPSAEATSSSMTATKPLIEDKGVESPIVPTATGSGLNGTTVTPEAAFTPGFTKNYHRLCFSNEGVLYEDSQLQIGVKSEYHGHLGRIALYFGNKISVGFTSFTLTVKSQEPEALAVTLPKMSMNSLGAMAQVQQIVEVECKDIFKRPPVLKISYLAGSLQEITLRLPVVLTKFVEPVQLAATDFFERWKQIGGPPREAQKVFAFKLNKQGQVDINRNKKIISGARVQVLAGIDPNPVNIVAAGVLHTQSSGKVGCLLRNEPNSQAKVSAQTTQLRATLAC